MCLCLMRPPSRLSGICLTMLSLCALAGCNRNEKRENVVPQSLQATSTVCFGRHIIDVPHDFFIGDGLSGTFSMRNRSALDKPWKIELQMVATGLSETQFRAGIASRKADLEASTSGNLDRVTESRSVGDNAHIFHVNAVNQAYSTELHMLVGGHYIVASADSYHDQFKEAEAQLIAFTRNMAERRSADTGSAAGDGYCFGALTVRGAFEKEYTTLLLRSKRHPDITIDVTSDTYAPDPTEPLLQRVEDEQSLLRRLKGDNKVIRKGELQVASMKAQEWLSWIMLGEGEERHKQYRLVLETMRPDPSPSKPLINIEMATGAVDDVGSARPLSLDEPQLVNLWDGVTRSLRPVQGKQVRP